jgi:hypothetical protein
VNFLALCKRLRSEAGIAGTGPASVSGQTGELGRLVDWIADAYEDIQDKHADWSFLRNDFSFNCVSGTGVYPASTVTDLANWKRDSLRVYLTTTDDEQWLEYRSWENFRDIRLMGSSRTQTGRPIEFSIKPDKSLIVWPIPDDTYTINGEFYKVAQVMADDTDEPVFERHHMAIVWNALMRYAAYVENPPLYAHAQKEYGRLIGKLEQDRRPCITVGRALA